MSESNGKFRAVSIEPDAFASCEAVRQQTSARYLCNDAPLLPLPDCTNHAQCRCTYKHWADRRQEDRRALANAIASQYYNNAERRTRADRRSS